MDERAWKTLLQRIRRGKVTPFIGAGASYPTLPTGTKVARSWAKEFDYPFPETENLTRVAQYLAVTDDPMAPKELIIDELEGLGPPDFKDPVEPHGVLADLDLPVYLTTNYDDFMTQALADRKKRPERELCKWNEFLRQDDNDSAFDDPSFEPSGDNPVVFHLHGTLDESESIVLTEDDYLEFVVNLSRHDGLLPPRIERSITAASLLFVGYSLEDWTFKVIFKGLIGPLESSLRRDSVAIQLPPESKGADTYLTDYFREKRVSVFWGDANTFMVELRQRLDAAKAEGADDDGE